MSVRYCFLLDSGDNKKLLVARILENVIQITLSEIDARNLLLHCHVNR